MALIGGLFGSHPYGVDPRQGALLAMAAGMLYGGYIMLMRRASGGIASVLPLAHATLAAAITAAVLGLAFGGLDLRPSWPAHGWLLLSAPHAQERVGDALARLVAVSGLDSMNTVLWLAAGVSATWWIVQLSVPDRRRRIEVR